MKKWLSRLFVVAVVLSLCVAAVGAAGPGRGHHRQAARQAVCLQADCPYHQESQADCPYYGQCGGGYWGAGCVNDYDGDGVCDYRALCTQLGGGWCR